MRTPVGRGDWSLVLTAELQDGAVVPTYTVMDPSHHPMGASQGPPVPARDWAAGQPATLKAAADAEVPESDRPAERHRGPAGDERSAQPAEPPPGDLLQGCDRRPGDGNFSLTRQMTAKLPNLGDVVQDNAKGADFTVEGQVKTAPGAGNTTRVEIQWIVTDAKGQENGRVVQLNEVPPHTLDQFWGEVAVVVANEASSGVHEVVTNATGRGKKPEATKASAEDDAKPGR